MKILKVIFLGIFFTLLAFLFAYGDVFAFEYSKNSDVTYSSSDGYIWKNNILHGARGERLTTYGVTADIKEKFNYNYDASYFYLPVSTNFNDNYYVFANRVNLPFFLNVESSKCETGNSIIMFHFDIASAYGNENDDILKNSDFFQGLSAYVYYTTSYAYDGHVSKNKCTVIRMAGGTSVNVACPKIDNPSRGYLHLDFASEPFKNLTADPGAKISLNVPVFARKNVEIACLKNPFVNATYTTDKDKVTVTVDNSDENITDYEFFLQGNDTGFIYQSSNIITYENLSNGVYILDYRVYYGNEAGTLNQLVINVTDSPLPVADFTMSQNGKNLVVDAGLSKAVKGNLVKYYFRLNDGEWIESFSSIYTFENLAYSNYSISVKVEDSNGNVSSVKMKTVGVMSPEEEQKNFWDYVMDFFKNFFSDLSTMFLRLFIPDNSVLESEINSLQSTLSSKLGFLGESVNFVIDEIYYVMGEHEPFTSYCLPKTSMPEEMSGLEIIPEGKACLTSEIMSNFSVVTSILKVITSLLLMGWFVNYCYQELMKVLGGVSV